MTTINYLILCTMILVMGMYFAQEGDLSAKEVRKETKSLKEKQVKL